MDTITVTIISVVIGTIVSVVSMFILMLKFIKEPLDKRIDNSCHELRRDIDTLRNELRQDLQELRKDIRLLFDKIIPPYHE